MGSDCIPHNLNRDVNYFNSRSPHGERSGFCIFSVTALFFQFTLPAWRATFCIFLLQIVLWIFNSRSPHGERRSLLTTKRTSPAFQFTLPAWRATVVGFSYDFILLLLFISANQEKAYFLPCFFGFSSLCCLWFAPVLLILFSRL